MDFKDLDKKTAIAVLDEIIGIINENKPVAGESNALIWFNAYTDVREVCHRLKEELQNV